MIVSGAVENALVIGAETLSRLLNWKDRTTCVLFGDGAGAAVLEASNASVGIESTVLHGDGSKGEFLMVPAGGVKIPASTDTVERGLHFITMAGGGGFKLALKSMGHAGAEAIPERGPTLNDNGPPTPHLPDLPIIHGGPQRLRF